MQQASLLQRSQRGGFKKPDITPFVPPEQRDAVARVIAAGMKILYSPDMRDEVMQEVQREGPLPQKLAESTVGLLLTLDKQSQGGIPVDAMFPAAIGLLGEAAEIMTAAGQPVTQSVYNEAAQLVFILMGRKLGMSDDQMMQGLEQQVGGGEAPTDDQRAQPMPQGNMPQEAMQ